MMTLVEKPDRLRREYLCKLESSAPLLRGYRSKGDFYFDGHRLSSLYRTLTLRASGLTKSIQVASSLQKILNSNANQKVTP